MVVVDVLRRFTPADCAHAALSSNESIELVDTDAVTPPEVVMATTSVQPAQGFPTARVVARLAIRVSDRPWSSCYAETLRAVSARRSLRTVWSEEEEE